MDFKLLKQELQNGLKTLENLENIITIFGGARVGKENPAYQSVAKLTYKLAKHNYSIMTGGGPGIMEAANYGIMHYKKTHPKADSIFSIGLNIQLPNEQNFNPFVEIPLQFENFFSRKFVFNSNTTAFIIAMGGYGTLDELSEILVQIATKKQQEIPIILYGKHYWKGLLKWLKHTMLAENAITKEELKLIKTANNPKEVLKILKNFYTKKSDFQLHTS